MGQSWSTIKAIDRAEYEHLRFVKVSRALVFVRRASRRSSRLPVKASACSRTFGEKACVGVDALGGPPLTTIPAPPHFWPRLRRKRCASPPSKRPPQTPDLACSRRYGAWRAKLQTPGRYRPECTLSAELADIESISRR